MLSMVTSHCYESTGLLHTAVLNWHGMLHSNILCYNFCQLQQLKGTYSYCSIICGVLFLSFRCCLTVSVSCTIKIDMGMGTAVIPR